jgi:hypothetical protein
MKKGARVKSCSGCGEAKPTIDFGIDRQKMDGFTSRCKGCSKLYSDANKERRKKIRDENIESINKDYRERYSNNPSYYAAKSAKYRRLNPKKLIESSRRYYRENKEKELARNKKYRTENRKKVNEYYRLRRSSDVGFAIEGRLRCRLYSAVGLSRKSDKTMKLVGCSIDDLLIHIEGLFVDGMGWENRGEWHIDHIKPCALFDLSKESEQMECFNYKNLQPLWAIDNLKKGVSYCEV